ncbi:BrnT family toxin [bacterium]|nr:BrnT family toxin [bacterium]
MEFEWHEQKSLGNSAKHGVTFAEAKTVFNDPFALTQADPEHSIDEERWLEMGISAAGRLLVVW